MKPTIRLSIKKQNLYSIFSWIMMFIMMFLLMEGAWLNHADASPNNPPGQKNHPLILSPEETLRIFLQAYIDRDVETIMAYLPNDNSEEIKIWREKYRTFCQKYMSPTRCIVDIIEIKLIQIENQAGSRTAIMTTILETSPEFSGLTVTDNSGKSTVVYRWAFCQTKENSPWLFDGGGF